MKKKYRIVTDRYAGYEVQVKLWWFPIWTQVDTINTHATIERAEKWLDEYLKDHKVVKVFYK